MKKKCCNSEMQMIEKQTFVLKIVCKDWKTCIFRQNLTYFCSHNPKNLTR